MAKKTDCAISTHSELRVISQPCDGTERTFYEDLTTNHNKTTIQVLSLATPPCTMFLVMETDEDPNPEPIPVPQEETAEFGAISVIGENVRRVAIICEGDPEGTCEGFVFFENTFCICCP